MRYAAPILVGLIAMLPPAAHLNAQSARPAFQDNYAEVNGVRLHYASVGRGPLVLFLHGYPSSELGDPCRSGTADQTQ